MDIKKTVKNWTEAIALMSTAHEPDQLDGAEALLDDSLHPILSAPVKQIREFYSKLVESLKADKRIPWLTVRLFESYEKLVVRNCEDQGIIRLKKKLATEIVDMAEETVRPQLGKAMVDALMWRSPEKLEALKERIESGETPQVRGRQSCLFLEAGKGKKKVSVML